MSITPTELCWSIIADIIESGLVTFRGPRVAAYQPETSEFCLEALQLIGSKKLEIFQSFRPEVRALEASGFKTSQVLQPEPLDFAIFVPTRQRQESLGLIAHALLNLKPAAHLLFACANIQGAKGFLTRLKDVYPDLEAESEQKCRWAALPAPPPEARRVLEGWIAEAQAGSVPDTSFRSVPGIYGWNKVDRGSIALATTLPPLEGTGADLGSGYGYLSSVALGQSPALRKLHVVEADSRALICAQENLSAWSQGCVFHWLDVTASETSTALGVGTLDWVIMNPPFHEGTQVDQSVGKSFIETAAKVLRPDGKLFMVANSFLGYEELLMKRFRKVSRVLDQDGFKVIHAVR